MALKVFSRLNAAWGPRIGGSACQPFVLNSRVWDFLWGVGVLMQVSGVATLAAILLWIPVAAVPEGIVLHGHATTCNPIPQKQSISIIL